MVKVIWQLEGKLLRLQAEEVVGKGYCYHAKKQFSAESKKSMSFHVADELVS